VTSLLILGTGGHARVVASIALATKNYRIVGFLDPVRADRSERITGAPVVGTFKDLATWRKKETAVALAIGDNRERHKLFQIAHRLGFRLPALIHPSAFIEKGVQIGNASIIAARAILATQVMVGNAAIINTGTSIDHESTIANFVHVAPGCAVAGRVTVEEGAFIGIGSSVIEKMRIGKWATVGAGSVVVRAIPANKTAFGTPARVKTQ